MHRLQGVYDLLKKKKKSHLKRSHTEQVYLHDIPEVIKSRSWKADQQLPGLGRLGAVVTRKGKGGGVGNLCDDRIVLYLDEGGDQRNPRM